MISIMLFNVFVDSGSYYQVHWSNKNALSILGETIITG